MQLFLSWALNEACRIFNLVALGKTRQTPNRSRARSWPATKTTFASAPCPSPSTAPLDQNGSGLSLPGQKCLKVVVLAPI